MTAPTEAIARLEMLARGCEVSGLDHLPIVSRDNAAAFASDIRTLLAELAEARKVIEFVAARDIALRAFGLLDIADRASEFIRRVGK